jgi:hypothetical protein
MKVQFLRHSGGCCGVRESFTAVTTVSQLDFNGVDTRFLLKTKFRGDQFIPSLQEKLAAHPNSAAVVMGNWCWFTFERASPARNFRPNSELRFAYLTPHPDTPLVSLWAFHPGHDNLLEENLFQADKHYECCLLTNQISPGMRRLTDLGFTCPITTINPNTGRKIHLFLKGPVENVPRHN